MTVPLTRPVGLITRGTTAPRRLRRVDRWLLAARPGLVAAPQLLVVDLGFGDRPVTTVELTRRLRSVNPRAEVVGLDLDPERVAAAIPAACPGLRFDVGGFELGGLRPTLVRALNVLRQYDETEVRAAWHLMTSALSPGGLVVEGTCDESGRLGAWISLDPSGPKTLTLAVDLLRDPAAVAARLPKALIHRNVPGEPVHRFLAELDAAWQRAASLSAFGAPHRFTASVAALRAAGWPVLDGRRRWRRGELTIAWEAIAPLAR